MRKLWKFHWDCGRMGDVEGLFVWPEEEAEASIGSEVYLGEVLGKHSDISGTLMRGEVKEVAMPDGNLGMLIAAFGYSAERQRVGLVGTNPMGYAEEALDA